MLGTTWVAPNEGSTVEDLLRAAGRIVVAHKDTLKIRTNLKLTGEMIQSHDYDRIDVALEKEIGTTARSSRDLLCDANDYYERICNAKNRFEAADLIRASATYFAANANCYNAEQRISIIEQANQQACSLERAYSEDGDSPVSEDHHPWRRWLREWGWPSIHETTFYSRNHSRIK